MARCGYCDEEDAEAHAEKCGERLGLANVKRGRLTQARQEILDRASEIIRDREGDYGSPRAHFVDVAEVWSAILGAEVKHWQVPACMAALKLLRLKAKPAHLDSWVDVAGYAALGAEIAEADE